jgi:thiol-disulfide isomerase/thioredoxin
MVRIGGVAFVLMLALAGGGAALAETAVGQIAPALQATELNGRPFDLARERGKVVIVNFWATWCAPCRAEMPALDAFERAFRDRGLVMVGISVDRGSNRDRVMTATKALSYPSAMLNAVTANGFGVPDAIPVTYVIDRAGVLRAILRPDRVAVTPQSLAETVLPLLRRKPPPVAAPMPFKRRRPAPK